MDIYVQLDQKLTHRQFALNVRVYKLVVVICVQNRTSLVPFGRKIQTNPSKTKSEGKVKMFHFSKVSLLSVGNKCL